MFFSELILPIYFPQLLCSDSRNDVPPVPQRNVSIAAERGAVRPSTVKVRISSVIPAVKARLLAECLEKGYISRVREYFPQYCRKAFYNNEINPFTPCVS